MKKIYIAADHAGFYLKEELKSFLVKLGYEVKDFGAFEYNEDDDYPDFIIPLAEAIYKDENSFGIILGGSGQGEAIAANKIKWLRAGVYYGGPLDIIKLLREHNNIHILSLGARFISKRRAKKAVKLFLETNFSIEDDRHIRRLNKINHIN